MSKGLPGEGIYIRVNGERVRGGSSNKGVYEE